MTAATKVTQPAAPQRGEILEAAERLARRERRVLKRLERHLESVRGHRATLVGILEDALDDLDRVSPDGTWERRPRTWAELDDARTFYAARARVVETLVRLDEFDRLEVLSSGRRGGLTVA